MVHITFKQFINENVFLDGVNFVLTKHFKERLKQRKEISNKDFSKFIQNIRAKISELPPHGYFCFTSKSLEHSIIAYWDSIKTTMNFITFLPKDLHFVKKDTEKVFVESLQQEIKIIWINL